MKHERIVAAISIGLAALLSSCAEQGGVRHAEIQGTGYFASPPPGENWALVKRSPDQLIFVKRPTGGTPPYQTVVASVHVGAATPDLPSSAAEFRSFVKRRYEQTIADRFELLKIDVTPFGEQDEFCAAIDSVQEERGSRFAPNRVLEIFEQSFICLDASKKYVVRVGYSERKEKGAPPRIDDALKRELDTFLHSVKVNPLKGSGSDSTVTVTTLHEAAGIGSASEVRRLIQEGQNVGARDDIGATPLHRACFGADSDVVKMLINQGAEVDAKDKDGSTPLHLAARIGNLNVVQLLVAEGVRVNERNRHGGTALHMAALGNHAETAEFLVDNGAEIDAQEENGQTPLHVAVGGDHYAVAEILMESGADASATNNDGETPIDWAINKGRWRIIELLTKHGAIKKQEWPL